MLEIAVCEDDKYSRIQIVRLLEKCAEIQEIEISVREFENGEKLLREIRAGLGIHLIYMDIEMDGINGLNTAKMIREDVYKRQSVPSTTASLSSHIRRGSSMETELSLKAMAAVLKPSCFKSCRPGCGHSAAALPMKVQGI